MTDKPLRRIFQIPRSAAVREGRGSHVSGPALRAGGVLVAFFHFESLSHQFARRGDPPSSCHLETTHSGRGGLFGHATPEGFNVRKNTGCACWGFPRSVLPGG